MKGMMTMKVLLGLESRCQRAKQAAGFAGAKALEAETQSVSSGGRRADSHALRRPCPDKGRLQRRPSPSWGPAALATQAYAIAGPGWAAILGPEQSWCTAAVNSQPGCKSESMETLQRNVLVAKPCPGSADSVGLCIF